MTDYDLSFDRRSLLRTTGAGVAGVATLSESGAAQTSGGEEIWRFQAGRPVYSSPTVVDGTVYVGSYDDNVYALDAGVEGSSEGSRVNLGTLGHHHVWADKASGAQSASVSVSDTTLPPEQDEVSTVTVDSAYLPEGGFVIIHDKRYEIGATFESIRGTSDYIQPDTEVSDLQITLDDSYTEDNEAIAIPYQDTNDNNKYDFRSSDGDEDGPYTDENDTIITDSGSIHFETFPEAYGFGFPNWGGQNTEDDEEDFDPPHDHQTIAEEEFNTQFEENWIPKLKESYPVPIPSAVFNAMSEAYYQTLSSGPEKVYSDGHCYGMCVVAKEYYEEGIPDSLPDGTERAAGIPQPTGDYEDVGSRIDQRHRSQPLDPVWGVILSKIQSLEPIDAEAEVEMIRSAIDQNGTALVAIASSPQFVDANTDEPGYVDEERNHQLLAYNLELYGGDTVSKADTAVLDVYDPNWKADTYSSNTLRLDIDISEPTLHPIHEPGNEGYFEAYHRFKLIGASRSEDLEYSALLVGDLINRFVEGLVSIVANSPVRIDAVAPDGTTLPHPEESVDGTPPSEIVYLTGADAGRYDIRVEGTGDGEYGIEVAGQTPEGGRIDDSVEGEITEGETQTVAATVPESEDGEGKASADEPTLFDYTNNNGVIDTANLREAIDEWRNGEAGTKLLRDVIDAWRSGDPVA